MIVYEPAVELKLPRAARPRRRELVSFLRRAIDATGLAGEVSVLLTGDAAIRALTGISAEKIRRPMCCPFPRRRRTEGVAGDLAISLETAIPQAEEYGHTLEMETQGSSAAWTAAPGGL